MFYSNLLFNCLSHCFRIKQGKSGKSNLYSDVRLEITDDSFLYICNFTLLLSKTVPYLKKQKLKKTVLDQTELEAINAGTESMFFKNRTTNQKTLSYNED